MKRLTTIIILTLLSALLLAACNNGAAINDAAVLAEAPRDGTDEIITLAEAMEIALRHAGLTEDQVTFNTAKLETDDGRRVYDIEYVFDGYEFELKINAVSGEVADFSKELADRETEAMTISGAPDNEPFEIHEEEREFSEITQRFDLSEDAAFTPAEETPAPEYAEFYVRDVDEMVEITIRNSSTGEVITYYPYQFISEEDAKWIALRHANLEEDQVVFVKVRLDVEDYGLEYDVEFTHDGWEYEYEIHAITGIIMEFDRERMD